MYIKFCFGFGVVCLGVGGNLKGDCRLCETERDRETERCFLAFQPSSPTEWTSVSASCF